MWIIGFAIILILALLAYKSTRVDYSVPFLKAGVPPKEVDECMRWAFGDDVFSLSIAESWKRWNKRHGDIFVLHSCDGVYESLYRIGRAYLQKKEVKSGKDKEKN